MGPAHQNQAQAGQPHVAIIVAMTRDRVIGSGGGIPWHLPDDLQLFKRLTADATLIRGRKTHASIGRPLPGRHNIVLSRTRQKLPGVQLCTTFRTALNDARQRQRPVFVIGGAELYRKALPIAEELHISWIEHDVSGDTHFPPFELAEWLCCEEQDFPGFHYARYRRKPTG
jgi:dihydrofolate reductase